MRYPESHLQPLGYETPDKLNCTRHRITRATCTYTAPVMFLNHFMTQGDKVEYAGSVFSHSPATT